MKKKQTNYYIQQQSDIHFHKIMVRKQYIMSVKSNAAPAILRNVQYIIYLYLLLSHRTAMLIHSRNYKFMD